MTAKSLLYVPLFTLGFSAHLLMSCKGGVERPKFGSKAPEGTGDTTPGNEEPGDDGDSPLNNELNFKVSGEIPGKRVWRLTNTQYSESVDALLNRATNIKGLLDAESAPSAGFGLESDALLVGGSFASTLEYAVYSSVKDSQADLEKQLPCAKFTAIDDACLLGFVDAFGSKAFHRPLTAEEKTRYKNVYTNLVNKKLSQAEALSAVSEAILRSPFAMFRFELGENAKGNQKLTTYELAEALSYAITNSPPDDELLAKAKDGTLANNDVYLDQATRLLESQGFVKAFTDYALRWSGAEWMNRLEKDAEHFPEFNPAVREAMIQEVKAFAEKTVKQKSSFDFFMTSENTTITAPLAPVYNLPAFEGTKDIEKGDGQRAGIVTLPGVVASLSSEAETSPMHRASFLMEKVRCLPTLVPPDDLGNPPKPDPNLPLREQFKIHLTAPSCAGCHITMDAYGFSLEHYDAMGRYRTEERGFPIDASGNLTGTQSSNGPFKDAVEMLNRLSKDTVAQECFVKNAFRYVNGRIDTKGDEALIANALKNFQGSNLDMRSVFLTLVNTDSFKTRKDGK